MSEAAIVAPARGERLHPLFLLTGLGKVLKGAWGIAVGGAYLAFQDKLELALLLLGGFVLLSVASLLVRWLTFAFYLEGDQLRIEQGLLNRSSRFIPFDRVTDVDIEQGPLHRLFGLARVRMETGASAASKDSEGLLDTITLERARAIRDHVRSRSRAAAEPAPQHDIEQTTGTPLFAMDSKRVLVAGVFNFSLAVIAALFGASQTLGDVVGFDPFSRAFWLDALARADPLRDYVLEHRFVAALGGTLVLTAVGVGTGIVRTLLREHGFRLERTTTGFRRRRGLLTLTDVSIPARRIQATILVTGPIKRAFGWFVLKFQSLASDGGQGSHVVAALAREGEVSAIQQSLERPLFPDAGAWRPYSNGQLRSMLVLSGAGIAIAVGAGIILTPFAFLAAAGLALASVVQWMAWRRGRYALDRCHLFLAGGWWRQRLAVVPVHRIQSIDIAESGWTRRFGFVRMRFGVAGGSLLSVFSIEALAREDAEALRSQLVMP